MNTCQVQSRKHCGLALCLSCRSHVKSYMHPSLRYNISGDTVLILTSTKYISQYTLLNRQYIGIQLYIELYQKCIFKKQMLLETVAITGVTYTYLKYVLCILLQPVIYFGVLYNDS